MMNEKCAACIHCEVCGLIESEVARDGSCAFYDDGERWIPVSERLPETDGIFLTYIENPYDSQLSYIMICDYIRQIWCPVDETASSNVIAWMPLPKPYEPQESEE